MDDSGEALEGDGDMGLGELPHGGGAAGEGELGGSDVVAAESGEELVVGVGGLGGVGVVPGGLG